MRMKVIALIGLAVFLAASPASAAALFGGGSGGNGSYTVGNGVVSGVFEGVPFEYSLSDIPTGGGDFAVLPSGPGPDVFVGTFDVLPEAQASEPLAALLVGLGLVGARVIRRRA
jgi:hypothetical protein